MRQTTFYFHHHHQRPPLAPFTLNKEPTVQAVLFVDIVTRDSVLLIVSPFPTGRHTWFVHTNTCIDA